MDVLVLLTTTSYIISYHLIYSCPDQVQSSLSLFCPAITVATTGAPPQLT